MLHAVLSVLVEVTHPHTPEPREGAPGRHGSSRSWVGGIRTRIMVGVRGCLIG